MIGQYLPNNNEIATVAFRQKNCQLNSPWAAGSAGLWLCLDLLKSVLCKKKIFRHIKLAIYIWSVVKHTDLILKGKDKEES
jgi:hypothetical protein